MKKNLFILFATFLLISCGGKTDKQQNSAVDQEDASITNVYYFHSKQRCKTCIAVGNVAKQTIEQNFKENNEIKFTEIDTSKKEYENLVKKYEVSWNALIISKGDNSTDITDQAFANAVNNPQALSELIVEEIEKLEK